MEKHIDFIQHMVAKGGPESSEYAQLSNTFSELAIQLQNKKLTQDDVQVFRATFGEALSSSTMQGLSLSKPHGYAGDYEMIDKIYREHLSYDPKWTNWDKYFHAQNAPKAVRNRKRYFHNLLSDLESFHQDGTISVLNVASGSSRDMFEFLGSSNGRIKFDCIEWDKNAISYSKKLCADYLDSIKFSQTNALKYKTEKRYRLIWSAGLFDYFDDRAFVHLLKRYYSHLDSHGELVIGNFSENNPSRAYMEIVGDWYLHHRSIEKLHSLALESGIPSTDTRIGQEPEGVNLFLHVKRNSDFIKGNAG